MKSFFICFAILLFTSFISQPNFLAEQKKYERVRTAYQEKENRVKQILKSNNIIKPGTTCINTEVKSVEPIRYK